MLAWGPARTVTRATHPAKPAPPQHTARNHGIHLQFQRHRPGSDLFLRDTLKEPVSAPGGRNQPPWQRKRGEDPNSVARAPARNWLEPWSGNAT